MPASTEQFESQKIVPSEPKTRACAGFDPLPQPQEKACTYCDDTPVHALQ